MVLLDNIEWKMSNNNKNKKQDLWWINIIHYIIITFATIFIFRWTWNLLDYYYFKDYFIKSNVYSIIIWLWIIILFKVFLKIKKEFL